MISRVYLIAAAASLPESLPEVDYFLKEINTPGWIFGIRTGIVLIVGGLALLSYFAIKRKMDYADEIE